MLKALALENFWSLNFLKAKKYSVSGQRSQFKTWLSVGLLAANVILLMSYIYSVNDFANKGYEIKVLQNKLTSLTADNKKINLKVSGATSMVSIQSDFLNANFVAAGTPKFLQETQLTER